MLERHLHSTDQRDAHLLLTHKGRELALRVRSAAAARNREWLEVLGGSEHAGFMGTVATLSTQARRMLSDEAGRAGAPEAPLARLPGASAASPATTTRPLVVDRPVFEEMRRQLDRLLTGEDAPSRE